MTALHASSEEVAEWVNSKNPAKEGGINQDNDGQKRLQQSQEASSSGSNNADELSSEKTKYSFICECFFMTARVLNLGLLKAFSDFKHLVQVFTRTFGRIKGRYYSSLTLSYFFSALIYFLHVI